MARNISPDERARRIAAYEAGKLAGTPMKEVARRQGIATETWRQWVISYEESGLFRHRAYRHDVTPPTTTRACMRCRSEFGSEGPHHRMCSNCRGYASTLDTPYAPDPGGSTGRQTQAKRQ